MTDQKNRIILDQTREPWTVEQVSLTTHGVLLRYRHDLGYELTAIARRPADDLTDEELKRLLEDVRRRTPRSPSPPSASPPSASPRSGVPEAA